MLKVFVIEDDPLFSRILQKTLGAIEGIEVIKFTKGQDALSELSEKPSLITIDYNLPDIDGLTLMEEIRKTLPTSKVIIVSGQEDIEVVLDAYSRGANGYVMKNEKGLLELKHLAGELISQVQLREEVESLRAKIVDREKYSRLVGNSKAILNVFKLIQKVEKSNILVLITGESGTGKELVAKALHYNSPRKKKNLVTLNMAAIPEELVESELFGHEKGAFTGAGSRRIGKFEEANGGTIFLDEIGELTPSVQAKLLRVLQESEVTRLGSNKTLKLDLRIIAATNRNLADDVKNGTFREDLYYRLQGFWIQLPPLRERDNDIILLANHFLAQTIRENNLSSIKLSREAIQRLLNHNWPGNVRELKSLIDRAAILCDNNLVQVDDLIFGQHV